MATLQYVGRAPDSDATITPKSYADAAAAAVVVTSGYVSSVIANDTAPLSMQSYVDAQNALLAQQSAVTTADGAFVPTTKLSVANGVAGLDSGANLIGTQVPSGVLTDRVFKCYSTAFPSASVGILGGTTSSTTGAIGTAFLTAATTVSTTVARELKLASIAIPDPGYPWRPWPFGWVMGNSAGGGAAPGRGLGNGNYGLLTVMPPVTVSNQIYGIGICTGSPFSDHYPIVPYAAAGQSTIQTPLNVPPIVGGLELDLYGCCWSGTSYTYLPTNLTFWVLVLPALAVS